MGDTRKAEFIPPAELDSIQASVFSFHQKADLSEYGKYMFDIMSDLQLSHSWYCVFSTTKNWNRITLE